MSEKYIGNVEEVTSLDDVANFLIENTNQSIKKIPTETLKEGVYKDLPIDSEFSNTSENAVKNKVIYKALEDKADVIINSASGTTVTTTDSAKVKPKNIKLFGKGKQRQYEGNQILNPSMYQFATGQVFKGIETTINEDGSVTLSGTPTAESGNLFALFTGNYIDVLIDGETYVSSESIEIVENGTLNWVEKVTVNKSTMTSIRPYIQRNTDNYVNGETVYPMFNKGTTVKPFEPFTGYEQSPNMKYPQKAEFLGESGSIAGKVLGKNFVKLPNATYEKNGLTFAIVDNLVHVYGTLTSKFVQTIKFEETIQMLKGVNYYISVDRDIPIRLAVGEKNVNNAAYVGNASPNASVIPYVDNGVINTLVFMTHETGLVGNTFDFYFRLQIEVGNVATDNEVYKESQPFTALTPNGLRGIPLGQTIPDAIKNSPIHMSGVYWDSAEGQYYIADTKNENGKDVQRISEYVVDGSNEWHLYNVDYEGFATAILPSNARRKNGFCNQQRVIDEYTSNTLGSKFSNSMWIGVDSVYIYLVYNSFFDTTLEDYGLANFKAHLNENPLKIWTWLDEPIITDTTDQYDVVMNYPNTTIVNDEGAYQEVTYICDSKNYIKNITKQYDEKIQQLESAILSLGGNV